MGITQKPTCHFNINSIGLYCCVQVLGWSFFFLFTDVLFQQKGNKIRSHIPGQENNQPGKSKAPEVESLRQFVGPKGMSQPK